MQRQEPEIKNMEINRSREISIISEMLEGEKPVFLDQMIPEVDYLLGSQKSKTSLAPAPPLPEKVQENIPVFLQNRYHIFQDVTIRAFQISN